MLFISAQGGAYWTPSESQLPESKVSTSAIILALFGYATKLARTHPEKKISHAWSTKWSLFAKKILEMGVTFRDESNGGN